MVRESVSTRTQQNAGIYLLKCFQFSDSYGITLIPNHKLLYCDCFTGTCHKLHTIFFPTTNTSNTIEFAGSSHKNGKVISTIAYLDSFLVFFPTLVSLKAESPLCSLVYKLDTYVQVYATSRTSKFITYIFLFFLCGVKNEIRLSYFGWDILAGSWLSAF